MRARAGTGADTLRAGTEADALRADTEADALRALVQADAVLMAQLRAVRALGLARWCIGAGAIRDRVWGLRAPGRAAGRGDNAAVDVDVDVAYFDEAPWVDTRDAALAARLRQAAPGVAWDVVHQGHVHRWMSARLGRPVAAFTSLEDGLASWPETATAVGVALRDDDTIDVIAPLGLADLLGGVLRRNPRCPDPHAWSDRLVSKRWLERRPGLRVAPD